MTTKTPRKARPPSLVSDDVEVRDGRAIFEENLPDTPETVNDRVEHCRLYPEQRGGPGAAAFDALFEIGLARALGFAWGPSGGVAEPPDEADPNSTFVVPAWIIAALALPWAEFRVKKVPDLDTAFGIKPTAENRLHYAERKMQDINNRSRIAQVQELMKKYGINQTSAIAIVSEVTGFHVRTIERSMKLSKQQGSGQPATTPKRS